jgi:plasmid stability protein
VTQLTIRRLDQAVIDGLKKRAATAGHSMEEEARRILSEAMGHALEDRLARRRAWVARIEAKRKQLLGDSTFSDSTEIIRRMRDERTAVNASWWTSDDKK